MDCELGKVFQTTDRTGESMGNIKLVLLLLLRELMLPPAFSLSYATSYCLPTLFTHALYMRLIACNNMYALARPLPCIMLLCERSWSIWWMDRQVGEKVYYTCFIPVVLSLLRAITVARSNQAYKSNHLHAMIPSTLASMR